MSLTELVLWNRLVTYLAARRWTISNWWIWDWWWGSHMQLLYSNLGLTSDWYARSLILGEATLRFRLRKLSCRDALAVMLSICLFHLRSFCNGHQTVSVLRLYPVPNTDTRRHLNVNYRMQCESMSWFHANYPTRSPDSYHSTIVVFFRNCCFGDIYETT